MKHIKKDSIVVNGVADTYSIVEGKITMVEYTIPNPIQDIFYRELKLTAAESVPQLITGIRGIIKPLVCLNMEDFESNLLGNKKINFIDVNNKDLSVEFFNKLTEEDIVLRPALDEIYYTLDLKPIPEPFSTNEFTVLTSTYYNLQKMEYVLKSSPYLLENRLDMIPKIEIKYLPMSLVDIDAKTQYLKFSVIPSRDVLRKAEQLCMMNNLVISKKNLSTFLFNPNYLNDWLGIKDCLKI